jgi:hypothetical protein
MTKIEVEHNEEGVFRKVGLALSTYIFQTGHSSSGWLRRIKLLEHGRLPQRTGMSLWISWSFRSYHPAKMRQQRCRGRPPTLSVIWKSGDNCESLSFPPGTLLTDTQMARN